jgi:hypothetical protein
LRRVQDTVQRFRQDNGTRRKAVVFIPVPHPGPSQIARRQCLSRSLAAGALRG